MSWYYFYVYIETQRRLQRFGFSDAMRFDTLKVRYTVMYRALMYLCYQLKNQLQLETNNFITIWYTIRYRHIFYLPTIIEEKYYSWFNHCAFTAMLSNFYQIASLICFIISKKAVRSYLLCRLPNYFNYIFIIYQCGKCHHLEVLSSIPPPPDCRYISK